MDNLNIFEEKQQTALKRLNFFYAQLKQEEDFKGANTIALQILQLETQIENYNKGLKIKELSPLH